MLCRTPALMTITVPLPQATQLQLPAYPVSGTWPISKFHLTDTLSLQITFLNSVVMPDEEGDEDSDQESTDHEDESD